MVENVAFNLFVILQSDRNIAPIIERLFEGRADLFIRSQLRNPAFEIFVLASRGDFKFFGIRGASLRYAHLYSILSGKATRLIRSSRSRERFRSTPGRVPPVGVEIGKLTYLRRGAGFVLASTALGVFIPASLLRTPSRSAPAGSHAAMKSHPAAAVHLDRRSD